jgi:hypothetical protein
VLFVTVAGGSKRRDDQELAAAGQLEKKVVNCLGCGKIYDCRNVTNDIIAFLGKNITIFLPMKVGTLQVGAWVVCSNPYVALASHDNGSV